jgi:hypothetical protein
MATIKKKNADGTWEPLQVIGEDMSKKPNVYRQTTEPDNVPAGTWWLDTSDNQFQGTVFANLDSKIEETNAQLAQTQTDLGDKTTLETKEKTSLVGAVNEHQSKVEKASNTQRSPVIYRSATGVRVIGKSYQMLGFRFMGQYFKHEAPFFEALNMNNIVSTSTDLGAETIVSLNNWYAIFAVANEGDVNTQFKLMPFLRVASVTDSTITLGEGGENSTPTTGKTYTFATDGLINSDILIINETLDSRANVFSGRVAKVTANTDTTITIDNIGTIGVGDYLLVAPPNFSYYRYLSTFYFDGAEVRNIADSSLDIGTRGVTQNKTSVNGDISAGVEVDLAGLIPPLATIGTVNIKQTLSTSSTGTFNLKIGMDSAHDIYDIFNRKDATTTTNHYEYGVKIPFAYKGQKFTMSSSGSIGTVPTRQIDVRGWLEP